MVIRKLIVDSTGTIFMLWASLLEGTRGVANIGGLTAYLDLCKRTSTPPLPYKCQLYFSELKESGKVWRLK